MTRTNLAQVAYSATNTAVGTGRTLEYEAIARVTRRLRISATSRDLDFAGFVEAVHQNRRLWTLFAADVASQNNQLAPSLRAQIFYLAEFTQNYSSKVLQDGASVDPLIDVNTAILKGLGKEVTS